MANVFQAAGIFLLVLLAALVLFGTGDAHSTCTLTHSADVCFDALNR